jgi:hypothetical protein
MGSCRLSVKMKFLVQALLAFATAVNAAAMPEPTPAPQQATTVLNTQYNGVTTIWTALVATSGTSILSC